MKKLIMLISMVIIAMSVCVITVCAVNFGAGGSIAVNKKCSERVAYAAQTLEKYLEKITGADFKLSTRGIIAIRESAQVPENGYTIKSNSNAVIITGNGTRGVIYGVYAFLQDYCDCRFYTSELSVIPKNKSLKVKNNINVTYKPYFEYTETDWRSPRDAVYSLANGLSGGVYRDLTEKQGGTVDYISNFCHTLTTQFCSSETYFSEHPEYFAMHDGERVPEQLCLTNSDVYKIVLKEVMTVLKEKHDPSAALQIISLTQHDNQKYCECETCAALDEKNGSHSGTMITFVNKIAKQVAKSGYNNVAIDTFAYQYTRQAPSAVKPLSNVIVRLCTIECCFAHTLDDASCELNTALMKDLSDWSKICKRIYVWDYTTNYAQTLGIFPDFGVLQRNMQTFYKNGVKGIYEEGNYYIDSCDTEFGELRAYLLSKLMQNPNCDYYSEMDGFLKNYYGDGWESIRQFIDIITDKAVVDGNHLSIYVSMKNTLGLTPEDIVLCDTLWDKAKQQATDIQLENVKRSELSWRYWKACSKVISAETKQLYTDMVAFGVTKYNEGTNTFGANFVYQYLSPEKWRDNDDTFMFVTRDVLGFGSAVIYGVCLILALALFILAIKNKKWLYVPIFPLMCGYIELAMWNRRAFLSWKDMLGLGITFAMFVLLFAYLGVCAAKAKGLPKKAVTASFVCAVVFVVTYLAVTYGVNIVLFSEKGNIQAISIAMFAIAFELLVLLSYTVRKFSNKDEEWS